MNKYAYKGAYEAIHEPSASAAANLYAPARPADRRQKKFSNKTAAS